MKKHVLFYLSIVCALSSMSVSSVCTAADETSGLDFPVVSDPVGIFEHIRLQVAEAAEAQKREQQLEELSQSMHETQYMLTGESEIPETALSAETETELPETEAATEMEAWPVGIGTTLTDPLPADPAETEGVAGQAGDEQAASAGQTGADDSQPDTDAGSETDGSQGPGTDTPAEPDDTADQETETQTEPAAEAESETEEAPVSPPRGGFFTVPETGVINEARLSMYDYRMLRAYPLAFLTKDLHDLYRQLDELTSGFEGTWSVYVQNLSTGQTMLLHDLPMRSASVMKLFIMEAVYEAFDEGKLVRGEDTVYLLRDMIINSSNSSSNKLLALLGDGDLAAGIDTVNAFIRRRGFSSDTIEYNGFEDPAAKIDPEHANTITAKDVGLLLSRIYNRSFISRRVCNEIEQMMLDQGTRYKIPRGLPDGVEAGNKSGETSSVANDAAVVYSSSVDYVLVVLSNDWSNENTANDNIVKISQLVYNYFEAGI